MTMWGQHFNINWEKKISEEATCMHYASPFISHSHFYFCWWFIKSLNWVIPLLLWITNLHFYSASANTSVNLISRRHAPLLSSRIYHSSLLVSFSNFALINLNTLGWAHSLSPAQYLACIVLLNQIYN